MYWIYLTVRYAPDNIRSTSRTTNPRQHDNTYASSTRQYIHVYLARSLLEGNGDSTASECDDEDDDYNEDEAINISHREEVSLGETTQRVIMRGKRRGTCRLQISIIKI